MASMTTTWTWWINCWTKSCRFRPMDSLGVVVLYAWILSLVYVLGLYVLVPFKIRQLPRDDPQHIQGRILAVSIVTLWAVWTWPLLFCQQEGDHGSTQVVSSLELLGFATTTTTRQNDSSYSSWTLLLGPLFHSFLLYLGPTMAFVIRISIQVQQSRRSLIQSLQNEIQLMVQRHYGGGLVWIRNLIVAPLTEEVCFRACIIPPLLSQHGMTPNKAAWVAPLFFGTAHVHHAYTKLRHVPRTNRHVIQPILISTAIQFMYTYLFGWYAAYAYIYTGSCWSIVASHAYCNFMGLPNVQLFVQVQSQSSLLYPFRFVIAGAYLMGLYAFVQGFRWVLPQEALLLQRVQTSLE